MPGMLFCAQSRLRLMGKVGFRWRVGRWGLLADHCKSQEGLKLAHPTEPFWKIGEEHEVFLFEFHLKQKLSKTFSAIRSFLDKVFENYPLQGTDCEIVVQPLLLTPEACSLNPIIKISRGSDMRMPIMSTNIPTSFPVFNADLMINILTQAHQMEVWPSLASRLALEACLASWGLAFPAYPWQELWRCLESLFEKTLARHHRFRTLVETKKVVNFLYIDFGSMMTAECIESPSWVQCYWR